MAGGEKVIRWSGLPFQAMLLICLNGEYITVPSLIVLS